MPQPPKKLTPKIILEGTRLTHKTDIAFAQAREERLKVSGNPGQYDDLEAFIREQEAFAEALQTSILPQLSVDVSDGNIPRICDQIASFMEANDLLGMP